MSNYYNDNNQSNQTNQNNQNPYSQRPQYVAQVEPYQQYGAPNNGKPNRKRSSAGPIIACTVSAALIGGMLGGAAGIAIGSNMLPEGQAQTQAQVEQIAQDAVQKALKDAQAAIQPVSASNMSAQALTYSQIAEKVTPSVVGINIKFTQQQRTIFGVMENEVEGAGSGVIITEDGYILTNNHVVDGATEISVILADGTEYPATIVGKDGDTDIAIIKVEATNLPAIEIGSSSDLKVGDVAVVVGNPLGRLQGSVSQGIISALNRELTIEGTTMNLLQTDAAVNEGNSGGALVNAQGELIGIVNAKTSAVGVEGLGFAIPVDDVRDIIDDLMTKGYVTNRPRIGLSGDSITDQQMQYYQVPKGVLVTGVEALSAAQVAGVQVGDIITKVNGADVTSVEEINEIKEQHNVGDTLKLTIYRYNSKETMEIDIVLQESYPLDN